MDQAKMTAFVEKAVDDVGALLGGALVVIGDKLGLYRAMAGPPRRRRQNWPPAPVRRSVTSASG